VHDRRARLGWAGAAELALGGERNTADARTAVAGGLADEDELRVGVLVEVVAKPFPQ
jgi:hypothetical protein